MGEPKYHREWLDAQELVPGKYKVGEITIIVYPDGSVDLYPARQFDNWAPGDAKLWDSCHDEVKLVSVKQPMKHDRFLSAFGLHDMQTGEIIGMF